MVFGIENLNVNFSLLFDKDLILGRLFNISNFSFFIWKMVVRIFNI